jgi:hypothetical protein
MSDTISALHSYDADKAGSEKLSFSYNDFRSQVGGGWDNVYPPIRARMDKLLTSSTSVVFEGMGSVRCSKIGGVFAQLAKFLGSPLVLKQGENVKTTVRVAPTANGLRCWHRLFIYPDGYEQLVQTSKVMDSKLGFIDAVGAEGEKRLATKMNVWTKGKSLYFSSSVYILRFKYLNITIPSILTPGTLFAEHRDLGDDLFRYILKFDHPLWGETFYQDGVFRMTDYLDKYTIV